MSTTADERVGTELLGYRIEAVVGRGGMGVVYRAYDPRLKRYVALKLLAPERAGDERFRERFLRESELAASLDHPNVIPIYEAGGADGVLYVAMRLVEGKDLKTLLVEEGTLGAARALAIAGQVAGALDAAHELGLVHRDVKPSNVLLDHREHVYLADFGLSRRLGEAGSALGAGLSLGTPAYVAPEQIEGNEVDGRADEYSLCCLLHECLIGQPPFPRASETAVLFAHLEEEPPAPERLAEVMAQGLAKDPAGRYPRCGELVTAARVALGITEPRRARWPFATAGVGAALLAAALLAFAFERGGSVATPALEGNAVAVIDPGSNRVSEEIPVGARPEGIAAGSGSLWVANLDDKTVSHIDPESGRVVRTLSVGDTPTGIAASTRAVLVVGSSPSQNSVSVSRIDPRFDTITKAASIDTSVVPGAGGSVATRGNVVWVAPEYGLLSRLDPRTSRVVQEIDPKSGPADVAVGADAVWVTDTDANTVTRVDPSGRLDPVAVGGGPSGIAVGVGAVWVADSLDDAVVRIDPRTRKVTKTIPVGAAPAGIAVGAGSVWVANSQDGTVMRIDPATSTVVKTIEVGGSPQQTVVEGGRVWVTVQSDAIAGTEKARPGGTARLVSRYPWNPPDPAFGWADPTLDYATCAKLLDYPDKPWPEGAKLVPEVATAPPRISSDGRTYIFTIRKGYRFSPPSNEPVTAQTFKYTLERLLNPKMKGSKGGYFFTDIVGAQAYMAGKAPHIAGIVARGNTLSIRLLTPAPDFLTRLAMPYSCVVPLGTPLDPAGVERLPSAGPYFVSSYNPKEGIVLERNPNYTGPRPHHLERIEVTFGVSSRKSVAEVESGAADYAGTGSVPPADVGRLEAHYGPHGTAVRRGAQRFFVNPAPSIGFMILNPNRPLFRDARLRRAVSYALDRQALAHAGTWAGVAPARPTDQYIPPGVPGFRDVHVYPFTPDLAEARRLAGTKRRTAVLYAPKTAQGARVAHIVKVDLNAIGIEVTVKAFPRESVSLHYGANEPYDLALAGWNGDYPDPSDYLNPIVEGGYGGPALPVAPPYRRKLAEAEKLAGPRRYVAMAALDAELARNVVPWVPYATGVSTDFFSARMGCQVYSPVYGIDLAALCIKER